jgi:hypothetical protein
VKLIQTEKNIVQLKMETYKAKEMTKASLQVQGLRVTEHV